MGDNLFPLIFLVVVAAAFWLLILRPAKARAAAQRSLIDTITPGDRILMASGMIGTVVSRGDGELEIEIAPSVIVTIVDQAVARVLTSPNAEEESGTDQTAAPSGSTTDTV